VHHGQSAVWRRTDRDRGGPRPLSPTARPVKTISHTLVVSGCAARRVGGTIATVRPVHVSVRVLALALAVGVGALLVGLSVAPRVLPGDTFNVTPRAAAGAMIMVGPADQLAVVHDSVSAFPSFAGGLVASSLGLLYVGCGLIVHIRQFRFLLVARSLPAAGCRGPPLRVNR
jgi:hypothetical protein